MKTLSLSVSDETYNSLKEAASRLGRSVSDLARGPLDAEAVRLRFADITPVSATGGADAVLMAELDTAASAANDPRNLR
ncbi:hypothetical protein LO763_22410 [Glycomyces sp. A-F 0318]|uniref:hypothetical protein n=1 Tax=Glycomyces amatae TaxID=2881355 RepID=UPI001E2A2BF4|nr:hypothetical protein [Glycomyces amatae]MCD0446372.1 hypothetical protein [Glycomyces amatae]